MSWRFLIVGPIIRFLIKPLEKLRRPARSLVSRLLIVRATAICATCSSSTDGNKVALTLVWNERSAKEAQPELPRLVKELSQSSLWHSIHVNYRGDKAGNAIFDYNPQKWAKLRGETHVIERLFDDDVVDLDAQLRLWFTPLTFRQANLKAFAGLVEKLAKWVPDDSHVCELYAGVGAIGLALRPKLVVVEVLGDEPQRAGLF